jgi:hypothetical protein
MPAVSTNGRVTARLLAFVRALLLGAALACAAAPRWLEAQAVRVERLGDGPIVIPHMDARMGANIAGPSLIRVPEWVEQPLGRYYLYFADHEGMYIRLAYADELTGPWRTHAPGTLRIEESRFPTTCPPCSGTGGEVYAHIASPDVHVDHDRREIAMYFHGRDVGRQVTRVATSRDGLRFEAGPEILGRPYFRAFEHDGWVYALAMPGWLYRSRDGRSGFEEGPQLFDDDMRHSALLKRGSTLHVFYTRAGEAPERILHATIELRGDWTTWRESAPVEVLRPEHDWEGADLPLEPSRRGSVDVPVNQLRDPAILEEDGSVHLLYSVAGERGIALARVHLGG